MRSFDWIELESLCLEISNAETQLAEALAGGLLYLAEDIEGRIANAKGRREHILEMVSRNTASLAIAPDADPGGALPRGTVIWLRDADRPQSDASTRDQSETRPVPADAQTEFPAEEADLEWKRLPVVLERARRDIRRRRAETLARQAEELRALDAEHQEIEALERALKTFVRKFGRRPEGAEVVRLDRARDLRMQHGAA